MRKGGITLDLNSGRLLWNETYPNPPSYPALNEDISCDVLVIGGGEAGALCAWRLSELGIDTVLIEKSKVGQGSTVANTGLLQYTNDTPLYELITKRGKEKAVRFYQLCEQAVNDLEAISKVLTEDVEYTRRDSIYYASSPADVAILNKEYEALMNNGFSVDYLVEPEIRELFGFRKPAALLTHGDAEINPYRLAHALIHDASHKNLRAYENTEVVSLDPEGKQTPVFTTTQNHKITCKYAVISVGYEIQEDSPLPGAEVTCTYTLATDVVADFGIWQHKTLIWETARPYLYIRTTADGRVLMGGRDGKVADGKQRDEVLIRETDKLKAELDKLFPQFAGTKVAYRWASSFGSTQDGLPLIGRHPDNSRCLYALGFGGNGTVYCTIAATIIAGLISRGDHPDAALFAPDRMRWYKAAARGLARLVVE